MYVCTFMFVNMKKYLVDPASLRESRLRIKTKTHKRREKKRKEIDLRKRHKIEEKKKKMKENKKSQIICFPAKKVNAYHI